MLCDRRRENKNCLALVRSKVIYFQKLTESHCRGFIYFHSECHYSVMQGTWAHAEVCSHKLEYGRGLLQSFWVLMVPGCWALVPRWTSHAQDGLSWWHVHFQTLHLSSDREHVSHCHLITHPLYSEAKEQGVGLLVLNLSSSGPLLEFLEKQRCLLQATYFASVVST